MAVFGAIIRDYTPAGKAGIFQGMRIFSQVLIAGVIGLGIGAAVLANSDTVRNNDGTTSFLPNENIFLAALVAEVVLVPLLLVVFRQLKKNLPKTEETV
jgi:MFS family permease